MKPWSPYEKYRQVRREAGATGVLLAVLILFWCFAGFGLSGVEGEVFGLPLWAVAGTVGVWCFAILGVALLVRFVFRDMPLEDEAAGGLPDDVPSAHARGGAAR